MLLRRAVGLLLTRRFSPPVIPRTAPARRSFHSSVSLLYPTLFYSDLRLQAPLSSRLILKQLSNGYGLRGAAGVAAAAFAGIGACAVLHFRKGPEDDEPASRKKEEEMKAMFDNWMKEFNKTYRDEREKAMRFQVFQDTVKRIESRPPSTQQKLHPPNCFADLTREERLCSQSCISR